MDTLASLAIVSIVTAMRLIRLSSGEVTAYIFLEYNRSDIVCQYQNSMLCRSLIDDIFNITEKISADRIILIRIGL